MKQIFYILFITLSFTNILDAQEPWGEEHIITDEEMFGIRHPNNTQLWDINEDGLLDLFSNSNKRLGWFEQLDGVAFSGVHVIEDITEQEIYIEYARLLDADSDGDGDIIFLAYVANPVNEHILYLSDNTGKGHFAPASPLLTLGHGASSFKDHDINEDGHPDLMIVNGSDDEIQWWLNDGNGTFTAELPIPTNLEISNARTELSDINNDGNTDILISANNGVYILVNTGQGSFNPPELLFSLGNTNRIFPTDMDADGDMDIIANHTESGEIRWYRNDGFGAFNDFVVMGLGVTPFSTVTISDMDNDGDMDVIMNHFSSGLIHFENLGGGLDFELHYEFSFCHTLTGVETVDLDNDGLMDYIVHMNLNFLVYKNLDDFVFEHTSSLNKIENILFSRLMSIADLNNDGDLDILTSSRCIPMFKWYDNEGGGDFGELEHVSNVGRAIESQLVRDLDQDNDWDIITAYQDNTTLDWNIGWMENTGHVNYQPIQPITLSRGLVDVVDMDGDGHLDIITVGSWLRNNGQEVFSEPNILADGDFLCKTVIDMDGDGDMDILMSQQGAAYWLLNDGQGQFTASPLITFDDDILLAVDLDEDGIMDFLTNSNHDLTWLQGGIDGNYSEHMLLENHIPDFVEHIEVDDVDLDGDLDIIIGVVVEGIFLYLHRNNGVEVFDESEIVCYDCAGWGIADMDCDGDNDFVLGSYFGDLKWVENHTLEPTPNTSFESPIHVFPNPATDEIHFRFECDEIPTRVVVHDMGGRKIHSQTDLSASSIRVAHWANGTYLISFLDTNGDRISTAKWHKM